MIESLRNLPAPAKLNLFLHVTGRRADGYHLLETVFEFVDLCDRVHLARRDDGAIVRRNPLAGLAPEADLAVRAARLLAAETGCRFGVEIAIDKRIPMGAGLGGGSSDAATVLLGLNRLWELRLDRRRLMALGLRLGADVPAFVFGRRAFARGIGERLRALPGEPAWFVLVAPPVAVPTASVFGCAKLTRDTKPLKISGLSRGRSVYRGKNDLEPVACAAWPRIAEALAALRLAADSAGADGRLARMTGSGACVFCPVPDEPAAAAIRKRLARQAVGTAYSVRSLPGHPLRDWSFA
ncbi:MAG: 4-(cytidine 5'-diphospho)-2-C-methyl-D-erythritol kinase [Burkholderiales bacterium]|nr:4-(cytidine 5'-diphospho)-2-C-methyl-D-erythritol kinase [Burkholderiaceae bacterium]MCZ2413290.1 4-(cytidine 5'-diphospho)-2-C-methyl-D-erythritol kinase [Burkholderiales bacterium]MEB2335132.1 4-(cytidine 5'-diphospho)-2-C-methyl-D-erythritol kinase [Burkholderiales bacterium]HMM51505.1 4-(cytidine 5'-diphospho)-2-C-methyl-D-erythritol kinase [Burkholderiaceae bacterium]